MTRLTVESVETVIVDLPTRRTHRFSTVAIDQQSYVLVRVRTADGVDGAGEAAVPGGPWWGGESVEAVKVVIDTYLAPVLIGRDASRVPQCAAAMDRVAAGNRVAKAAIEMALFDAWGKALGVPVHELWGGLCRESLRVTWALSADEAATILKEAEARLEDGHSSFKLKMGALDPAADVARVLEVTRALGPQVSVRVDLNGAWDEPTARRWLPELEAGGVALIEQPLPYWNVEASARLTRSLRVPIMADETVCSPADAYRVARCHAADVVAVKIPKCGGAARAGKVAAVAEAAGIACHGGTTLESSLGTAACAHLYCATANVTDGSELFGPLLLHEDITEEPVTYRDGEIIPPKGPGLGVRVDEAQVARFRRD